MAVRQTAGDALAASGVYVFPEQVFPIKDHPRLKNVGRGVVEDHVKLLMDQFRVIGVRTPNLLLVTEDDPALSANDFQPSSPNFNAHRLFALGGQHTVEAVRRLLTESSSLPTFIASIKRGLCADIYLSSKLDLTQAAAVRMIFFWSRVRFYTQHFQLLLMRAIICS